MSAFLLTSLLASAAAAQYTTSMWIPGAEDAKLKFIGSVIDAKNDKTTLSIKYESPESEDYYGEAPKTVTVAGTTYVGYSADMGFSYPSVTESMSMAMACSRGTASNAIATCEITTRNFDAFTKNYCSVLAAETTRTTAAELEELCTSPTSVATETTMTMSGEMAAYMNNFELIITAGTEKIGASAAATPSSSGASLTRAVSSGATPAPSAASSSGVVQQSTNAAAPAMTMAPMLAGMGAAVAAYFL